MDVGYVVRGRMSILFLHNVEGHPKRCVVSTNSDCVLSCDPISEADTVDDWSLKVLNDVISNDVFHKTRTK